MEGEGVIRGAVCKHGKKRVMFLWGGGGMLSALAVAEGLQATAC